MVLMTKGREPCFLLRFYKCKLATMHKDQCCWDKALKEKGEKRKKYGICS